MTETEFADINRQFWKKFEDVYFRYGHKPETVYLSMPIWYAICCHLSGDVSTIRHTESGVRMWNGLPVVRVMDENYFELR